MALTYRLTGRIHLCAANGRQVSKENMQTERRHQSCQTTAKYLRCHAEHHHIFGTEAALKENSTRKEKIERLAQQKSFRGLSNGFGCFETIQTNSTVMLR